MTVDGYRVHHAARREGRLNVVSAPVADGLRQEYGWCWTSTETAIDLLVVSPDSGDIIDKRRTVLSRADVDGDSLTAVQWVRLAVMAEAVIKEILDRSRHVSAGQREV